MSEIAFLFPGQGSQAPGMGLELAEHFSSAREVFEEADAALGFPLSRLCFEGPAEELQLTANTQPAILAVSVAAARVLEEKGIRPDYVAGHSLGEYSALVAAGSMELADALRLVRKRGQYMQEAVPVGQGAMAALLGLDAGAVDEICREAAGDEVVSAANLNSPAQIVIAGDRAAVERAVELAKARGAKRAILLNVSAPFHCSLMKPAADRLAVDLDAVAIRDPRVPLVNNADAAVVRTADAARDGLKRQVTSPVRWTDSMLALRREGADIFVEAGPGKVLSGLMRQIDREAQTWRAGDTASIEEVVGAVQPQ
ncbi:MAG TPA: ACP S-malonyltransferase [Terriglobia bacterium]|nr:ACP S-malonyltransferase [Terriglobia bacterium]